ncbi:hypothetical protein BD324DRAFT_182161 [Kockovaella imperatae]|uniref:P-loop containing nucleoside triphosphate hydrolase protein n=1 Tax=Kockovaella imperatae TaxID=4999 RepID=A0A1Y1U7A8_9TREE|nr:hypothetical protein BD324DRAFT_182161 [Kockovaella imperatae]ORX33892.1 hypothetical protein BD324DRAFT_182161 [Kockovaella imperatae]
MSVIAATPHDPHTDSMRSTPPPSTTAYTNHPPPFHHSISSPVVVPFPFYQPRKRSFHDMPHTQSFSALGPPRSDLLSTESDSPGPSVPPPAPRLSFQDLPAVSPEVTNGVLIPAQLPPTPDPSPPNSKVLFTPDDSISFAEIPRRLPSDPSPSVQKPHSPPRSRAMTNVPRRPPNEHRPKSMGPPRPVRKSQTMMHPSSIRMAESSSADGRHRLGTPIESPGFPRTMTAPADTTFGSGDATPSELASPDGLEAKVVLLGSQGVGKTSLILRYTKGTFNLAPATIGSSLHTRKLVHSGVRVKLQIWDTAGQERFRSMAPIYYRGANVCILVYDTNDRQSFEDVRSWLEELQKTLPKETAIYIVGSKTDLAAREVSIDEAKRKLQIWRRPQPRGLLRSSSLAAHDPISSPATPTRSHSSSALVALNTEAEPSKPPSRVPFPSRPSLQIIPPSTLPSSPRSTKISFGNMKSPTRPTSSTFTDPVVPLMTSASHATSAGRFSISGVLGYSRTNSTGNAVSTLARLAEDYPAAPRDDITPVRRVRIESTPHMIDTRRKSEDWSSRPWRMGQGPGAAEALGEFGAGVRRRQSGGDLLEPESRPTSNFGLKNGRIRAGSVGRDVRLYDESAATEEWGMDVLGIRLGEVSALNGQGIDALFQSISALLVEKRENIERDRTLRRKDSVMLLDLSKTDTTDHKTKRGCCV